MNEEHTPRERAHAFAAAFRNNANGYAFAYGGPVYLVGSTLTASLPGDIDIRCAVAREDLELWFGSDFDNVGSDWTPAAFSRHREELKQSRRLTRRWSGGHAWFGRRLRIDFQFQSALFGVSGEPVQDDRPRLRLDAVPNEMLRAGLGEP
jgi:hypothetical protein